MSVKIFSWILSMTMLSSGYLLVKENSLQNWSFKVFQQLVCLLVSSCMYQGFGIRCSEWRNTWTHRWEGTSATHHSFKQFSIRTLGSYCPSNNYAYWKSICISSFSWYLLWNLHRMAWFTSSHSIIKALWVAHHLAGVSYKDKSRTKILWYVVIFSVVVT